MATGLVTNAVLTTVLRRTWEDPAVAAMPRARLIGTTVRLVVRGLDNATSDRPGGRS